MTRDAALVNMRFFSVAEEFPERVALKFGSSAGWASWSYRELAQRVRRLASLMAEAGIGAGDAVGVVARRHPDTIATIIAVLHRGAHYVPLDGTYPESRLQQLCRDAGVQHVFSATAVANPDRFGRPLHAVDRIGPVVDEVPPEDVEISEDSAAYVMFTSGSTGEPKGVVVPHRAILRLIDKPNFMRLDERSVFLGMAPLSFDASTLEIWAPLLNGGSCVLYPDDALPTTADLKRVIRATGVNCAWFTASLFNNIVDQDVSALEGIEQILSGGEALSVRHVAKAIRALQGVQIINGYGPTENTTFTTCYRIPPDFSASAPRVPIGVPISGTDIVVVDDRLQPVPRGTEGELIALGRGLALGYLNKPELTSQRFVELTLPDGKRARGYRTGDRVVIRDDGLVDYLGRFDDQVKIEGHRIEPGEIENAIAAFPGIAACRVLVRTGPGGQKRLAAYAVTADATADAQALRAFLAARLPAFMVPHYIYFLDALPVNANGKIDKAALPDPFADAPALPNAAEIVQTIAQAWREILGHGTTSTDVNFFDAGGTSLDAVRLGEILAARFAQPLPPTFVYEYASIDAQARALAAFGRDGQPGLRAQACGASRGTADAIAVVGMAGRFPGARSVDELWANLCAGREGIRFFSPDELDPSIPESLRNDPDYVAARGVIDDYDKFDAGFFGISPLEAQIMDPQQRVLLETAWSALESAAHVPSQFAGRIGVYVGTNWARYRAHCLLGRPDVLERYGEFNAALVNEAEFLATRISYKLGLRGPSVTIGTACSTSLVAIAQAAEALRNGQCDIALAGGVSIVVPTMAGYLHQEGSMLSADGHCRSFDAAGTGTTFNDGAAVVVLRRLDDALADGDEIHAVIRGFAVNNDGADKVSFTAPSVQGQAAVVRAALDSAAIDPDSIGFIEAHGTATPMGDPIEVAALKSVFGGPRADGTHCVLGSVKSAVGHLIHAAGATGFIKAALVVRHGRIPPTLFFETPNPSLGLADSPFRVNAQLEEWPDNGHPRRAGVSSFGVGGTNAHIIIEQPPQRIVSTPAAQPQPQLITLSARSESALNQMTADLAAHLEAHREIDLADVAATLMLGRKAFDHRRSVVAADMADAIALLRAPGGSKVTTRKVGKEKPSVVFMFPGQGAQYVAMGRELYAHQPAYRRAMDDCAGILEPLLGVDLRDALYRVDDTAAAAEALRNTALTQPAIFSLEYSLAQFWMSLGVQPSACIGHSVGEFVGATLAGVFSLEDALKLVARRGELMQGLPGGSMLSVRMSATDICSRLPASVSVASENGPLLCVIAGPTEEIEHIQRVLEAEEVVCRLLQTSHAFHSPMMDPVLAPFGEVVQQARLSAPKIPFVSTVTGDWITNEQALDPGYWTHHLRATVRFASAVKLLLDDPSRVLIELGPRNTLGTLARQAGGQYRPLAVIASLADEPAKEAETLLQGVGQLWSCGGDIDWRAFVGAGPLRRIALPTYPFERQRYWIDPAAMPCKVEIASTIRPPGTAPASSSATPPATIRNEVSVMNAPTPMFSSNRKSQLVSRLKGLFEDVSGFEMADVNPGDTFLDIGLDSLTLTQVALQVQQAFGIKVTFRQLMQDYQCLDALAGFLDAQMPAEAIQPSEPAAQPVPAAMPAVSVPAQPSLQPMPMSSIGAPIGAPSNFVQQVVDAQLQLMSQQLALLRGVPPAVGASMPAAVTPQQPAQPPAVPVAAAATPTVAPSRAGVDEEVPAGPVKYDAAKAFGAIARIHANRTDSMTPLQKTRLEAFIRRYNLKTQSSKRFTQENRVVMADPRAVTGFRPAIKEIVYPIVIDRSKGAYLWDLDGNQYIDALCGFGPCMFGWQPEFVVKAVKEQIDRGFEIGPQHPLQADVARLVCELTGAERAAFCNTGSEAVMGCTRIARTVTGRNLIAIFTGSYHGIFDEVIVRGTKKLKSVPAAPGIMPSSSQNVLVLDYGTPESLEILKSRAHELAAIMVEPVQSRRPDFQPREFLHELRKLTEESGSLLIFDEVVTGFRTGPGGAQEYFGIKADLASYGKVLGGGMPIGVIAGKAQYMDALDGGYWQYGDDSTPPVGVTYFAGTFVRHPLALAAAHAVLTHLKEQGPSLQKNLTERTAHFVAELNAFAKAQGAPITVKTFASLWRATWDNDQPFGDLLFFMMRDRGVHLYDGFPCFLTTAHTDADVAKIVQAFKDSLMELIEGGFVVGCQPAVKAQVLDPAKPPVPNARIGRDPDGSPAWFVPNPDAPGKYMKLGV